MSNWFTVLIPTRNSAAWIGTLLGHYQARGIIPTVLLDSRTTDNTRAIAEGFGAQIVDIHGFTHTEAIVRMAKDYVTSPWALFIHDDEIPSEKLFARLHGPQPREDVQTVAISRRWVWYESGKSLTYGRSSQWQDRAGWPGEDHHWRLFRPDQVVYVPTMHWDGYYINRWSRFPSDTYIVHFEWVLRTQAQRAAKLRRYDEHRWGYGKFFEKYYLPEMQAPEVIEYLPFETHAYDQLASIYFAARGPDPKLPRRSLRTHIARLKKAFIDRIYPPDFSKESADRKGLSVRADYEVMDTVEVSQPIAHDRPR